MDSQDKVVPVDLMGVKEIPKELRTIRIKNISGKLEEMIVPMEADIIQADPVTQQIIDDNEQLKNAGDYRVMKQQGSIIAPDGETIIPTELTFVRRRNENGGVDVTCCIPALGMTGK